MASGEDRPPIVLLPGSLGRAESLLGLSEKAEALAALHRGVQEGETRRTLVGHTGGGFVSCGCARFDPDGQVTFANAGHLAPFVNGAEVTVESGLPLGVVAGVEYPETQLGMAPRDQVTLDIVKKFNRVFGRCVCDVEVLAGHVPQGDQSLQKGLALRRWRFAERDKGQEAHAAHARRLGGCQPGLEGRA